MAEIYVIHRAELIKRIHQALDAQACNPSYFCEAEIRRIVVLGQLVK
jgi:hypothetical protein